MCRKELRAKILRSNGNGVAVRTHGITYVVFSTSWRKYDIK